MFVGRKIHVSLLLACILNTSVLTSIPRKNSILYPEYWYEALFFWIAGVTVPKTFEHIVELFIFTKEHSLLTSSHFAKVFLTCSSCFAVSYCISYMTWTLYMGYNHPLPFVGFFLLIGDVAVNFFAFWFLFPIEMRSQEELKRKCITFLLYQLWTVLQSIPEEIISIAATSQLQWVIILLIPLAKTSRDTSAKKLNFMLLLYKLP